MSRPVSASAWAFVRDHRQAAAQEAHLQWARARAARARTKEARTRFLRLVIVCVLFAALIGASFGAQTLVEAGLPDFDAIMKPSATAQSGQITYRLADGKTCRRETFDNDFAEARTGSYVPCENTMTKPSLRPRTERHFNWGHP